MNDSARLQAIRDDLNAIAPGHWTLGADGDGMLVEGRGEMGELIVLARFSAQANADEARFMADAVENVRFLLDLLGKSFAEIRKLKGVPDKSMSWRELREAGASPAPGNFAAEAAMKCGEPAFKAFMEERHGLERPLTDERVAQRLRSVLGIDSRARLNDDDGAAARWKALRAEFQAWRKVGA